MKAGCIEYGIFCTSFCKDSEQIKESRFATSVKYKILCKKKFMSFPGSAQGPAEATSVFMWRTAGLRILGMEYLEEGFS
jgi:hypothetical protein